MKNMLKYQYLKEFKPCKKRNEPFHSLFFNAGKVHFSIVKNLFNSKNF